MGLSLPRKRGAAGQTREPVTGTVLGMPNTSATTPGNPSTAPPAERRHLAARAAGWSVRHRRVAIVGWLAIVILATVLGGALGTHEPKSIDNSAGDERQAQVTMAAAGLADPMSESVLVQAHSANSPPGALRTAVLDVSGRLTATGIAKNLQQPFAPTGSASAGGQLSADGRSALVTFDLPGNQDNAPDPAPLLAATAAAAKAHPNLRIEEMGDATANKEINKIVGGDLAKAGLLALPITLGILLAIFGSVVAALLPVGLALTAIMAATGLLAFTSRIWPVDSSTGSVVFLIGLAVGVDYCLFYLRREREERQKGASPERALAIAAQTSGHAVLVSGITVAFAMAGLGFTGLGVFTGMASGTVLVVLMAMLGSLTVLPAMLSWLGDRVETGRLPGRRGRDSQAGRESKHRFTGWLVDGVLTRPIAVTVLTVGALGALAIPALSLHTGDQGFQDVPRDNAVVATFNRINDTFPGSPGPAQVVVSGRAAREAVGQQAIAQLRARAQQTGAATGAGTIRTSADGSVTVVSLPLPGDGTDKQSLAALKTLRHQVIKPLVAEPGMSGITMKVTGTTASSADFSAQLASRTPLVVGFVLLLAMGLLLMAFRSPQVAAIAIGSTLLSVGAAYGVLALVFQHHWADGLLDYTSTGHITAWLPLFMFVVLFGLSTDYQVFVLSRVQEAIRDGMPAKQAVPFAVRRTAGVVTSAALIMVSVFAVFASLSLVDMKQLGVGLAVAVLVDATVVRVILMPALLVLLGDRAWKHTRRQATSSPRITATPEAVSQAARDLVSP